MAKIRVTPRTLRSRADELETLNNKFKNEVARLREFNTTMGRQWKGDSRNAFDKAFQNDASKFDEFHKGISDFIRILRQNADEYDQVENKNTSIANVRKA